MKRKNFEVATVRENAREYGPKRWPSVVVDVTVPFLQAVITGVFLAMLITGVLWGFLGLDFAKTFGLSVAVSVITAWFWRLGVITETLWDVEEKIGVDLDRDGSVGKPRLSVRVEIKNDRKTSNVDIEGLETVEELRQFAILGVTNRLNERVVKNQFDWSRDEWQDVRDELIRRELVVWNGRENSTQGVSLTEDGEKVMRAILDDLSPTSVAVS